MFTKFHITFFTSTCDFLNYSDQLCKNLFHLGWWIYYFIKPYNATHREITLFHGHEPIELHDPIIVGFHIIWNMSWVHKHVTQCSTIMNDIFLNNVCACENCHNFVFTHIPSQCAFTCATRYFGELKFHHINDVGKVLVLYAPSSIFLKVGWYTWVSGIKAAFSTLHVTMAYIPLFFMKPLFFISNVCM